jgi:hypothetical protein
MINDDSWVDGDQVTNGEAIVRLYLAGISRRRCDQHFANDIKTGGRKENLSSKGAECRF